MLAEAQHILYMLLDKLRISWCFQVENIHVLKLAAATLSV